MVSRTNLEILRRELLRMTIIVSLFALPTPAYAQSPSPGVDIGSKFGFGGIKSLGEATSNLVMPIFSLAAVAVVVYFLLGAFKYLRSDGNKEEVEGARQMITQAIVGFMILIFAFFVLQFIPQFLNLPGLGIIK